MAIQVIAHRGASADALENSLAAFRRAVALGADGIELDVHSTLDGAFVVHHDPVVPAVGPALARAVRDVGARPRRTRLRELLADELGESAG